MKKIITLNICLFFAAAVSFAQKSNSNNNFTLTIDVRSIKPMPETVILTYMPFLRSTVFVQSDSAEVKNGIAVLKGAVNEPMLGTLQTKYFGESGKFYLVPGKLYIKAEGSIKKIAVSGSPYEKDFELMQKQKEVYEAQLEKIGAENRKALRAKDTTMAKATYMKFQEINKRIATEVYKPFVIKYAKISPIGLTALSLYDAYELPKTDSLFNLLAPRYKALPSGLSLKDKLSKITPKVGDIAPEFSQPDTLGKIISLKDYRGKYVLVDFWASWCHPCRAESPFLIKAFNKFKGKNFSILSVSLDTKQNKEAWIHAIHQDKVNLWAQVSDLKGWNNGVSTLYGIRSIPQNYLLDENGKIIATNLRGEDLEKKLETLFKDN